MDLLFEFEGCGALAEDDVGVVVGRDERGAGARDHVRDDGFALRGRAAAEDHARPVAFCRGDLGRRRDRWHHDVGGDAARAGGEGEGLRVVAWRMGTG